MKAYWIAVYRDIKNSENIKEYGEKATPAIKKYNGVMHYSPNNKMIRDVLKIEGVRIDD